MKQKIIFFIFIIIQEIFSIILITKTVDKNSNYVIFCDFTSKLEEINQIMTNIIQ